MTTLNGIIQFNLGFQLIIHFFIQMIEAADTDLKYCQTHHEASPRQHVGGSEVGGKKPLICSVACACLDPA